MCLTTMSWESDTQPDKDLGKCVKPGCRNEVWTESDRNWVFGVPTIWLDIPGKMQKSVADHQNYGDEPDAVEILFPSTFTELGISETDFRALRSWEEIRSLFENIGFTYKVGKFNAMYNWGKEYCNSPDDRCSVRGFIQAVKDLDAME